MTDPDQLLAGLDPEQREVATSLGGPVAVIAGAGTGKTRAITHRIAYGVASGIYKPTSVLAVTFTTRAAGEMRGRLSRLGAHGVQARTFHSAALRQAQYFWPKAYGSELPGIAENRMSLVAEAASRLRLQVDTARLRDLVGEIGWSKVSNVTVEDYPRIAARNRRELASFDPETVARVFAGYEDIKRDRNRIDFEDILLCTAALISEHPQVAAEIRGTYRHLVVDEYQDVSPLQQALLDLWRGPSEDICVVGDPAQTIHSFAGARSDYLRQFARRHHDATVVRLVRDYRSTPQVVKVANAVMARARQAPGTDAGMGSVTLQAQRPTGPDVSFAEAADEPSEAAGVAEWLAARHAAGTDYREMAILFRVNAQSPAYEAALAERSIPYLVRGAERFFERPEVRQALITLRTQARTGSAVTSAGDGTDDGPGDGESVAGLVRAIFSSLGWTPEPPTGAGQLRERWESLAALVSAVEDVVREHPDADLAAVSAELDRRAEAQHVPAADGVTVSTLHSAKGLEWDAVAVVGAHEGTLPFVLASGEQEIEEERRLLYVGVTRAREHLRVSWSRTRNGGGSQRQPSRFLDGIRPGDVGGGPAGAGQPTRTRRRGSVLSANCRQCGKPLTDAGERKLGRHHGCPSTYDEGIVTALRDWRRERAKEQSLPAFCIFTDATLIAIAESMPGSPAELTKISGIGPAKVAKYGSDVITLLSPKDAS